VRVVKGPFPPFEGVDEVVIDPHGGWLDARACLQALEARALAAGAEVRRGVAATATRAGVVALDDGSRIDARAVVVAAGFHAPRLVPALRARIKVTRQVELFFDAPLDYPSSPPFAAFEEGFYGFPDTGGAVKIADHRKGPTVTDFERRPPATEKEIAVARAWLARRIPALASRPVIRQRVCLYDNTSDDHFILARADGVVVAAGFSGHGFKFGPVLGEELAKMAG
jgi:sarcosine oxidase